MSQQGLGRWSYVGGRTIDVKAVPKVGGPDPEEDGIGRCQTTGTKDGEDAPEQES